MMADKIKTEKAVNVYHKLIETLDSIGWQYSILEDEPGVTYTVNGDDMIMEFIVTINPDAQILHFLSVLPMRFDEDKRLDGLMAACAVSSTVPWGTFSFNMENSKIVYGASSIFSDCEVNEGWFTQQMDMAHAVVDMFNDRFLALAKGYMTIEEFIAQIS